MNTRQVDPADVARWEALTGTTSVPAHYVPPFRAADDCAPCQGVWSETAGEGPVIRVPWAVDHDDLVALATGAALWLSTLGMVPVHSVALATDPPQVLTPRPATDTEQARWAGWDTLEVLPVNIGGPDEGPGVRPLPALVALDGLQVEQVHVVFDLDEITLAGLAGHRTLWFSSWAPHLVPHRLEVVPA